MLPVVSINGTIIQSQHTDSSEGTLPLGISSLDRGFTLGDGIFETLKVVEGTPWYLPLHLERLEQAATFMGIGYPSAQIQDWIGTVVHHVRTNGIEHFALRITLTRGPSDKAGLAITGVNSATTVIMAMALPDFPSTIYEQGITVRIASARRNDRAYTTRIKTTSYAESVMAFKEARETGFDDAVFLNTYDFVAEASASNVFICLNGVVVTPAITQGILPGITRAVVLQLARSADIPTAEREVHDEELINADEAFLTSSLREIVPVVKVGDHTLGHGTPGLLTRQLMSAYRDARNR